MAVIQLPRLLADQAAGTREFRVDAPTLRTALRELPIADLLFDERGELRPLVNLYVDGVDARERGGLDARLGDDDTVRVVAAIAGGATGPA